MKIDIFHIDTCMGKLYFSQLPFLSEDEIKEFNLIGYTGKNSNGEKLNYREYLNSLTKGTFVVDKTKCDNGDFMERYTIVRVL